MKDEILDLVDENDQVVGKAPRSYIYQNNLIHQIRAVWFFIRNKEGKLWIPKRTANKRNCPLALDASAVGHVETGESYEFALYREVQEELNIDLSKFNIREIGYFSPHKDGVKAFVKAYEIESDEIPNYNKEDYIESYWLSPEEIIEKIESGIYAKGDLSVLIKLLYFK